MVLLIFGVLLAAFVVFEIVIGQIWLRFFYVFRVTVYRDESPVGYWVIIAVQGLIALGLLSGGLMQLLTR